MCVRDRDRERMCVCVCSSERERDRLRYQGNVKERYIDSDIIFQRTGWSSEGTFKFSFAYTWVHSLSMSDQFCTTPKKQKKNARCEIGDEKLRW